MHNRRPLGGYIKHLLSTDGGRQLALAMRAHTGLACAGAGVPAAELRRFIDEGAMRRLIDAVVEDLATRTLPSGQTSAAAYLDGPGADDPRETHAYATSLREAGMGLYRIESVQPGLGFIVSDMLFPGPAMPVVASAASRQVVPGNMIAARMLRQAGVTVVLGTYFVLPGYAGEDLAQELRGVLDSAGRDTDDKAAAAAVVLRAHTHMFSNAWLACEFAARASAARSMRASA